MNLDRILIACTLTIVGIAGCAADPGKKVNSAEADLTSEQQKAKTEEHDRNAEASRKHETDHAEGNAEKNLATSEAKKDVAVAKADLAQDRRDFDTKTKERLAKLDAKVKELKTKSPKLAGKKAADYKAHQTTFTTQRADVNAKVTGLETSTNDGWATAKKDVEKTLDSLETTLDNMEKSF
jgi:hypothetical protein